MSRARRRREARDRERERTRSRRSVERRLRDQERELSDRTRKQRRRRRAARDVYGAIGFETMWRDGICEVERGLFSQTVSFSDVSYQSARQEVIAVHSDRYRELRPAICLDTVDDLGNES